MTDGPGQGSALSGRDAAPRGLVVAFQEHVADAIAAGGPRSGLSSCIRGGRGLPRRTCPAGRGRRRPAPPEPDHANVKYGPHERNVFDLRLARSETPAPLVIYCHGGGFRGGDKRTISTQLLNRLHEAGVSFAAANYRLTNVAPFTGCPQGRAYCL
jgi:acetyl esterase/lipase